MTDARTSETATSHEVEIHAVLDRLARFAATAAQKVEDEKELVREDPECRMYRSWEHEAMGKRVAFQDVMMKARRMDNDGVLDGWKMAVWLWQEHQYSNEQRSDATGDSELYWRSYHSATGTALEQVRELAEIEHDDPDPIMGRLG